MSPYAHDTSILFGYHGQFIADAMYGGIVWLVPIVILVASVFFSERKRLIVLGSVMILAVCVVIVFNTFAAGLLARYMMDFSLPLAMAGAGTYFWWIEKARKNEEPKGLSVTYLPWLRRFGVFSLIASGLFQYAIFMG